MSEAPPPAESAPPSSSAPGGADAPAEPQPGAQSPTSASPQRLQMTKIERLYVYVANSMEHLQEFARALPDRSAPDSEVDDEDVTAFFIEQDLSKAVCFLELGAITGRSLASSGLNFFLREAKMKALQEAQEKKGREPLSDAEIQVIVAELTEQYEQERTAKRQKRVRKIMADILKDRIYESKVKAEVKRRLASRGTKGTGPL